MEIISRFLFLMCELWNLLQHHSISDVPSYNLAVLSPCYYMVQRCGLSVGSLSTAYHNHWRGALVWACVHPMRPGQLKIPCTIAQCCVHWLSHNLWWPSYQSPLPVLAAICKLVRSTRSSPVCSSWNDVVCQDHQQINLTLEDVLIFHQDHKSWRDKGAFCWLNAFMACDLAAAALLHDFWIHCSISLRLAATQD